MYYTNIIFAAFERYTLKGFQVYFYVKVEAKMGPQYCSFLQFKIYAIRVSLNPNINKYLWL